MKFFGPMLVGLVVLAGGFVLGAKYQAHVESRSSTHALLQVQQAKIEKLKGDALRLRTALLLRDYLEEVRLKIPRATYQSMVDAIGDASLRYGVPPETILAVIRIESTFDVNATSEAGAIGLMQVLPSTAEEVARELRMEWPGEDKLRDPAANIAIGTYYLTKLLGRFDNLALALAAYNEGPGRVAGREAERSEAASEYALKVMDYASP